MERYLTKLIAVNFVAGIFAILFGIMISDLSIYAQQPKPLPLPVSTQSTSHIASSPKIYSDSTVRYDVEALGQKESKSKSGGFLGRIRDVIFGNDSDFDDEDNSNAKSSENSDRNNNRLRQISPAQPITPPKPITVRPKDQQPEAPTISQDSRFKKTNDSANHTNSMVPAVRSNSTTYISQDDEPYFKNSNENSSFSRLHKMREDIFKSQPELSDEAAYNRGAGIDPNIRPSELLNSVDEIPYPEPNVNNLSRQEDNQPNPFKKHNPWGYESNDNYQTRTGQNHNSAYSDMSYRSRDNAHGEAKTTKHNAWNLPAEPRIPASQVASSSAHIARNVSSNQLQKPNQISSDKSNQTASEKRLTVSPLIEVETEGDSRVIVGRESKYRIRVSNRGGTTAEQVVLNIGIPQWIKLSSVMTSGGTEIRKENAKTELLDYVWTVGNIEPNKEETLELLLTPQERKAIDLQIIYNYRNPPTKATILVEEAVLEMELQGPDEILWGTENKYLLAVRNTGSGDAEKVRLELMETGSELKECIFPVIKAGEEKLIEVLVWAGKQQRSVDINIQANGAYNVNAKIEKKVKILRPEVTMSVETAETQFVGSPAEVVIKIKNSGNAEAKNLDLAVMIPIGAKYISSTNGGELMPQNHVKWNIESLPVNGEFLASVVCSPNREGVCKIDTVLKDKEDSVAQCTSVFTAEAITDLRMFVESPNGPIEVGQEAVFVINVTNRGTKMAGNVGLFVYCSGGLKPISTVGEKSKINNGIVEFDLIPAISAGQTVVLKVVTKAERGGNHRIRAELISPYNADVAAGKVEPQTKLLSEQTLNFYQRKGVTSKQTQTVTTQPQTNNSPKKSASETATYDPFPM
ncbi:MAG: DUF11 domain-containing protein [Planctomycetaceae bacterium]|jgi:hypothetical protein|nr:DUF11 domain-containing protein [Planctomycetaceae bacterium]